MPKAPVRRPPTIRRGDVSVTPGLPQEMVERVVRQNFGRYRLCYERGLDLDPKLAGTVKARFVIDHAGNVVSVVDGGSTLASAEVVQCVLRGFENFAFPASQGGVDVTVLYSLILTPEPSP